MASALDAFVAITIVFTFVGLSLLLLLVLTLPIFAVRLSSLSFFSCSGRLCSE